MTVLGYPCKFTSPAQLQSEPQSQLLHTFIPSCAHSMATPNPLQGGNPSSVSVKTIHIAGILTDIYGLEELPPSCQTISCIWLLHPRLQQKEIMSSVANSCLTGWNQRASSDRKGLIAVAFDQRNHGTRCVHELSNEAWRQGNVYHAQDMWRSVPDSVPRLNTHILSGTPHST